MKYKFLNFTLSFILCFNASGQTDCRFYKSVKEMNNLLSQKPITGVYYYEFNLDCNVSNLVRKKMIYNLDRQWTKTEIDNYLERYFNESRTFYRVDTLAKEIGGKNDSLIKVAFDSIKNSIKLTESERIDYSINDNVILGCAYINLKEAIPILQRAIKKPINFNINTVELALARFGDRFFQKKIINNCKSNSTINGIDWVNNFLFNEAEKLFFISSQESIYKMNEWIQLNFCTIVKQIEVNR